MSIIRQLFDWLAVKDYTNAKQRAAVETAARYSRGNVSVQNGWFLDDAGLKELSAAGDRAIVRLQRKVIHH
jgi:hypothetical protein